MTIKTYDHQLSATHFLDWAYENGERIGFFITHPNTETGEECGGFIPLGKGEWIIKQEDPLTIYPSVDCFYCKDHGSIIDGRWNSARDNYARYAGDHFVVCVQGNQHRRCRACRENPKLNMVLRFFYCFLRFAGTSSV